VKAISGAAFEAAAVEQRHEQLKILWLAAMRRRRHEQQVPCELPQKLAEAVALGVLHLASWPRSSRSTSTST
jgi:hypothetical protein